MKQVCDISQSRHYIYKLVSVIHMRIYLRSNSEISSEYLEFMSLASGKLVPEKNDLHISNIQIHSLLTEKHTILPLILQKHKC